MSYHNSLRPTHHASKPSLDTNASGIADSTISFSAFPHPPSSVPTPPISPISPSFHSASTRGPGSPIRPLVPRRPQHRGLPVPNSASTSASTAYAQDAQSSAGGSRPLPDFAKAKVGAHPWDDAASNISGMSGDAADDRLLPTSFITNLLQENKDLRKAQRRTSTASEALSGISEMTYPPPEDASRYRQFRGQPSKLGKVPPSSFVPIPEAAVHRVSSDSDTLHSVQCHSDADPLSKHAPSSYSFPSSGAQHRAEFPTSVSGHEKDDDDDSIMQYKAALDRPPLPPSYNQTQRRALRDQYSQDARHSVHSYKSIAPSFISRISDGAASIKRILYRRKSTKPLPPVPLIPDIPLAVENQYRRADEAAPINELVHRAGQLHGLLEKQYGQHESYYSGYKSDASTFNSGQNTTRTESWQPLRRRDVNDPSASQAHNYGVYETHGTSNSGGTSRRCSCFPSQKITRRTWLILGVGLAIVALVAIIVPVVLTTRSKAEANKCEAGLAGTLCDINASCMCTSGASQCNGLAQSIVEMIPVMNEKFAGNFTNSDVYSSLWLTQGTTGKRDCTSQAWLIDTGKDLTAQSQPQRRQWTQAALLWHIVRSQDVTVASTMQKFVRERRWADLGADGATATSAAAFTSTFAGYSYNFAGMTVSEPSTTFVSQGVPLAAQAERVGPKARNALNRIYTYALASSTQREVALRNYWTTTLSQRVEDLGMFKGMLNRAPILLPFNATSTNIRPLWTSSSLLFPPPLACYPGFSPESIAQLQTFETTVFNLESPTPASSFDATCFPDRPIYGVLDLLRLRLPYLEGRPWLPRQAAVLEADAHPRAVVYVNEMMSATFPGSTPRDKFTPSELDPRNYGTLNLPNHVILQYLSSMPVDTAKLLVEFVVRSAGKPPVPPERTSALFQSLASIPPLEVAVFGNVRPSDVSGTVSSFTTSTDSFFFGTEAAAAMRNWTIETAEGTVAWAENSTSPRIVRDNSLADPTVDQAWRAVAASLGGPSNVGLSNLTTSFETTQKFSPS